MTGLTISVAGGAVPALTPGFGIGVNISGMEWEPGPNAKAGTNYVVPTLAELTYYKSQGLDLIRLPIAWETMQPVLGGPLNAVYLAQVESVVKTAAALGMKVILDITGFGGYDGSKIGTAAVTDADFANLWKQLATAFAGNAGIGGYDLMNEPSNMPSATAWTSAAQAAITAIRTVDTATTIYVEGNDYSNAQNWAALNPGLAQLYDPSNNLIFSAHVYLDNDGSGTHYDWAQQAAAGDTTNIGVQRLSGFVAWLQANGLKGELGEVGAGNDNPAWLTALDSTISYARANGLAVTYWAGGLWWGSYPLSVEPVGGVTAPQMAVLDKYSGAYPVVAVAAVSGTAPANSTVYLSENDVLLATTQANAAGAWSTTLSGLADGVHVIVAGENPPTQDGTIAAAVFDLVPANEEAACFAAGTRIATPQGARDVAQLRAGDLVITTNGPAPVIWIGRRKIDLSRHARPEAVRPVRIFAGAIADGQPARDLWVSPDHALLLGGFLVPAKALLNGVSIAQPARRRVTYYHVELAAHGVIFAEGVEAESYLESGNRGAFENCAGAVTLHPDFAQGLREAKGCAPFAESGKVVEAARARILARMGMAMTDDPALRVSFSNGDAVIRSRSAVPGYVTPDPRDRRALGVKVSRLLVGGREIAVDHPLLVEGWHEMEADGRWTSGRAVIPKALLAGSRDVTPVVVATMWYPLSTPMRVRA